MMKECNNCKSRTIEVTDYPCSECDAGDKWEPSRTVELHTRAAAINLVDAERDRQGRKWGEENHSQQGWIGILGEEFGEYCQAVNETYLNNATKQNLGGYDQIMKELTHVAAVAVGAMESLMRNREEK